MGAKQLQLPMYEINEIIQEGNLKTNKDELINQIEISRNLLKSKTKEGLNHINTNQAIIEAIPFFQFKF